MHACKLQPTSEWHSLKKNLEENHAAPEPLNDARLQRASIKDALRDLGFRTPTLRAPNGHMPLAGARQIKLQAKHVKDRGVQGSLLAIPIKVDAKQLKQCPGGLTGVVGKDITRDI